LGSASLVLEKRLRRIRLPESKRANYKPYAGIIIAKCSYHFDKNSLCVFGAFLWLER
jgi:hypothetical protein